MRNELLLIGSVILFYGGVLVWYRLFGKKGLMAWTVFSTIAANMEVLILVDAFGMEQTLGNVMFATSFLVTDIISETTGKEDANRTVNLGILASITFIIVSQFWLTFQPSPNDFVFGSFQTIFSNTPRTMAASLIVYAIAQRLDVALYHGWWKLTTKWCGDSHKYLWLRNNGSTLISQLVNNVLFTLGAFLGTYDWPTLLGIMAASYIIYIFTSLLDTPVVYAARWMKEKNMIPED